MVLPSARKKDGCVRPGKIGKFIKDDHDSQPFKIETLDGSASNFYHEGDMRKATDAEIQEAKRAADGAKRYPLVIGAGNDEFNGCYEVSPLFLLAIFNL